MTRGLITDAKSIAASFPAPLLGLGCKVDGGKFSFKNALNWEFDFFQITTNIDPVYPITVLWGLCSCAWNGYRVYGLGSNGLMNRFLSVGKLRMLTSNHHNIRAWVSGRVGGWVCLS